MYSCKGVVEKRIYKLNQVGTQCTVVEVCGGEIQQAAEGWYTVYSCIGVVEERINKLKPGLGRQIF